MYDALLALQRSLSRLPREGLPDAVTRSIQGQPSYGEADPLPGGRFTPWVDYQSFAPDAQKQVETATRGFGERERLRQELGWAREVVPKMEYAAPEGAVARYAPYGSPYSQPYNLGLGNLGALY